MNHLFFFSIQYCGRRRELNIHVRCVSAKCKKENQDQGKLVVQTTFEQQNTVRILQLEQGAVVNMNSG